MKNHLPLFVLPCLQIRRVAHITFTVQENGTAGVGDVALAQTSVKQPRKPISNWSTNFSTYCVSQ